MSVIEYSDSVVEGPAIEPLDLAQVKRHLKVSGTSEDTLIDGYISAARQQLEQDCGRDLIRRKRERRYHLAMPTLIELPKPPLLSVDSIQYDDGSGTLATLSTSDYVVDPPSRDRREDAEPAVITPAYGVTWPTPVAVRNCVRVRFFSGYGPSPSDVPEVLRQILMAMVESRYRYRGMVVSGESGGDPVVVPLGYDEYVRNLKWMARCKYQPEDGVAAVVA